MAVPKKKTSKSRRDMRRSHDGLKLIQSVECQNCGALHLPHHICNSCGSYNKNQIVKRPKDTVDSKKD
ncbi:MAG: 50S ribosomal protein L32 [Holosporales bacterium]|jgi:large subunit ribosomal protein L32|nr:50S ribosomal protein L32 [Holosporales bacterium]